MEAGCRDAPSKYGACFTLFEKEKVKNTGVTRSTLTRIILYKASIRSDAFSRYMVEGRTIFELQHESLHSMNQLCLN